MYILIRKKKVIKMAKKKMAKKMENVNYNGFSHNGGKKLTC